jgi:hypothetical protein
MAITTVHPQYTEWYTINGTSMANFGFAVSSVSTSLPDRKGQNYSTPVIHGDIWREKRFGPRSETWNIWVSDANPDTGAVANSVGQRRAQFNSNLDELNSVLNTLTQYSTSNGSLQVKKYNMVEVGSVSYSSNTSTTITFSRSSHGLSTGDKVSISGMTNAAFNIDKKVITAVTTNTFTVDAVAGSATGPDSGTLYATVEKVAYAEVASSYSVDDHREFGFTQFSVDLFFPDPRWYATSTTTVTLNTGSTQSISTSNIGNAPITDMSIVITAVGGSLVNPALVNSTIAASTSSIGYSGTLASGESVTINTSNLTALKGVTNVIASLTRSGDRQDWMEIYPSQTNYFDITGTGTGTAAITYTKAYL